MKTQQGISYRMLAYHHRMTILPVVQRIDTISVNVSTSEIKSRYSDTVMRRGRWRYEIPRKPKLERHSTETGTCHCRMSGSISPRIADDPGGTCPCESTTSNST